MTTATETDIGTLIWRKEGMNGGRPCLAGTGMSVRQVAIRHNEGLSPQEILEDYDHLDLARIFAALTYYYANKAAIDNDIAEEEALYAEGLAKAKQARAFA